MIYGLFAPTQVEDQTEAFKQVRTFLDAIKADADEGLAFVSRGLPGFDSLVAREAKRYYPEAHLQLITAHGSSEFDADLKRIGEKLVAPPNDDPESERDRVALSVVDEAIFFMEEDKGELSDLLARAKETAQTNGSTVRVSSLRGYSTNQGPTAGPPSETTVRMAKKPTMPGFILRKPRNESSR